jgi:hypothetical protein
VPQEGSVVAAPASSDRASTAAEQSATTDRRATARGPSATIEQLVRSVAVVAGLFYVLGFLTTNAYLYRLGVSDFSLLRTRFILTGVLTLAPLALALVWGIYAALDLAVYGGERGLSRHAALWVLADVAVPFVLYFLLFAFVAENDVVTAARDAGLLSVLCALVVLAFLGSLSLYRTSQRRPLSHLIYRNRDVPYERFSARFGVPTTVVETMTFGVGGVLLILTYIGVFGHHFYPTIPEQIGGGRPRLVQLLVAADAAPAARELGLDVSAEAPLSPPLELLWEGEESYVVRLPDPHQRAVAQIARGLVDGLVSGEVLSPTGSGN